MQKHIVAATIIASACLAAHDAQAKQPSHSATKASTSTIVSKGARVIDGTGTPATDRYVVIQVKKIKSITAAQPKEIAAGTRVIDAGGKTILANLIVLDADPSVDIKNTERINSVWIDGTEQ